MQLWRNFYPVKVTGETTGMMLANLEEVGCYNKSCYAKKEREARMLASAKRNLEEFAFFGITEYLEESGILFEKRLGLQFGKPMEQLPFSISVHLQH